MSACFPCRQKIRGIVTGAKGIPDPTAPQSLPDMKWWCTTSETRQKKAQQKFEVEMEGSCAPEQLLDFIPGGGGAVEALIRGASTDSMADAGNALNLVQQMFEQEPSSSSAMLSKCFFGHRCFIRESTTSYVCLASVQVPQIPRPRRSPRPKRRPRPRGRPSRRPLWASSSRGRSAQRTGSRSCVLWACVRALGPCVLYM